MQSAITGAVGLAAELEAQSRRLAALVLRVDDARRRLPSDDDGVWRGPARQLYSAALEHLRTDLGTSLTTLEAAAATSRRALVIAGNHA